jgi:uncharacterized protein
MAITVRPVGIRCNLACQYCYQNVLRDAGAHQERLDLDALKQALVEAGQPFHLFGGEPLLLPIAALEELFRLGAERYGENAVQTNGILITDAHIALFTRYNVRVGVSIDGPGPLNDARWAGSLERTRTCTQQTLDAIDKLVATGRPPGLLVQLTRCNAVGPNLETLCGWLRELDAKGLPSARLHILELDGTAARERYGLTVEENVGALRRLLVEARSFRTLRLDLVDDLRALLMMEDQDVACVFRACDPLTTESVTGIGATGEPHKCGLTDKEGVNFLRPEQQGHERYLALYATPQQFGGCGGCRFFAVCKGQCPGTGIDGDWRNRSESCEVWRELFQHVEDQLVREGHTPLSVHPQRRAVEQRLLDGWANGENLDLAKLRADVLPDSGHAHEGERMAVASPAGARPRCLDFALPTFHRIAWASRGAREVWTAPLQLAAAATTERAVAAAAAGVLPAALVVVPPYQAPGLLLRFLRAGRSARVLGECAPAAVAGSTVHTRAAGDLWCIVGESARVAAVHDAWERDDGRGVLAMLERPDCCNAAALSHDPLRAPAWASVAGAAGEAPSGNYLLHRLGIAPTPHLPCGPACAESLRIASALNDDAALTAILRWPMHWSALHGIAEVLTPVFRLVHDVLATAERAEVRIGSLADAPPETPTGVTFPFRPSSIVPIERRRGFQRGLVNAAYGTRAPAVARVRSVPLRELSPADPPGEAPVLVRGVSVADGVMNAGLAQPADGTGASLRRNEHATYTTVLRGCREWVLCPPTSDVRLLEDQPNLFDSAVRARLSRRGLALHEAVQQPGELLYMPAGWWRQTRDVEPTQAITSSVFPPFMESDPWQ